MMTQLPPEQLAELVQITERMRLRQPLSAPNPSGLIREGNLLVHYGRSTQSPEDVLEFLRNEREDLILHGE